MPAKAVQNCGGGYARREADGSYGSQMVVNIPEKGAISITRTMRKVPGTCDSSQGGVAGAGSLSHLP